MGRVTRASDRHIIWSNRSLDVDDWREDYKEFLEANELDDDPNDEQALYEWMVETNDDYLSGERNGSGNRQGREEETPRCAREG